MKNTAFRCILIILLLSFALTGCNSPATPTSDDVSPSPPGITGNTEGETGYTYSQYLDENGFLSGIRATDYVTLFNYSELVIPSDIHDVSEETLQSELESMLNYYKYSDQIHDRPVEDGDTVNIDYIGSIDGIPFDGGSTGGQGTDVTLGETQYIDNFLEQLIGHMPGDSFDIFVTFPEDYFSTDLAGKAAVFAATVNYIAGTEEVVPEYNDDFVMSILNEQYGWVNTDEATAGIKALISKDAIQNYIYTYLTNNVEVSSVPQIAIDSINANMLADYQYYADSYAMSLDEFTSAYLGYDSIEALIEDNLSQSEETAKLTLIVQAIAEDIGLVITTEDMASYFKEYYGYDDTTELEADYGTPFLKQAVLLSKVLDYLTEKAILE